MGIDRRAIWTSCDIIRCMKKHRILIQFDVATMDALKKVQEQTGASIAEIVRRFVKAGLAARKK